MNKEETLVQFIHGSRDLFNNLSGLFFIKDIESNFRECSQDFLKILQVNRKDVIGCSDDTLPWAVFTEQYQSRDHRAIRKEESDVWEPVPVNKTTILTFRTLKRPLQNEAGEVFGILGQMNILSANNKLGEAFSCINLQDRKNTSLSGKMPESYQISHYDSTLKLSTREAECLFLIIRAKSAKEIAKFLGISYRTVETHVENIKHKMGVTSRSEIVSKAIQMEMLEIIPKSKLLVSLCQDPKKLQQLFAL